MFSSLLLSHQRSRPFSELLRTRVLTRLMGGGPRTFPGGLNKWQWKRLHEKRAREKEKRLLEQEKQLYQARIRSDIRARLAPKLEDPDSAAPTHGAMTPQDHIKKLADRFMKAGAEDLWNEKDGPEKDQVPMSSGRSGFVGQNQRPGSISSPVDLRKLVYGGEKNAGSNGDCTNGRKYSVQSGSAKPFSHDLGQRGVVKNRGLLSNSAKPFARDWAWKERRFTRNERPSGGGKDDGSGNVRDSVKNRGFSAQKQRWFRRNESSSSEDDDDDEDDDFEEGVGRGRSVREIESRAALGKYDMKITKRVPLQRIEEEFDFGKEVEWIRYEIGKRKKLSESEFEQREKKGEEDSFLSEKRFDESGISPLTVKALTAAGYVQMTRVQEATISVCHEGKDALVKAKTGTGKSFAFLLPAIEAVLKATSSNSKRHVSPVFVLIVCPTRELASQIAAEAKALLKYHDDIGVQTLVGGTRFKVDQKRLESDPHQIIVATPGRLLDHVENKGGLSVHLMGLKMLVLDEADRLLDLGFRKDIEKIVDCIPRQRQSLLLSATIPKEVRRISQLVLKREHGYVDTVGLGSVETHSKVKQSFLVVPHELHFQVVHHLLKQHILQEPDYKVIVFCTTGMVTSLMHLLLREMKMNVREMHSRKPQPYRTHVCDEFKESKQLILVTSDVSARGMNYPDVSLVIQVGIPPDREQYIHRLGRTGREGKDGEGILLLAPWEEYFLEELKDLPLERFPQPHIDPETGHKVEEAMLKIDGSVKEAAYHAWLGYYNSIREIGRDKTTLVELANQFSQSIGLQRPPPLFRKTALKMGLKDITSIRIRR